MRKSLMRALVTLCALGALGAAGVAVSTVDTTDRPAAVDDDPGTDPLDRDRSRRIPTAITPEPRHGCGTLPTAFDDLAAGYALCYPQGWGFLALDAAAPRLELDALEAASVRLADAATFPWVPGTLPLDAVAAGATIIEITTLPSFTANPDNGDCRPEESLNAITRVCELRIDPMSSAPDAAGTVLEMLSVHDLGGRVALARSYLPATASVAHRELVRTILRTLQPLPSGGAR